MLEIENIEFQKRIMQYISVGYTPKEIATEIGQGCNNRTIEHYIETMKKRYQVKNTPALLAMFFRRKLIK